MFLGIDIGGTNIKFGVAGENYKIIKAYCIPTEKDRGDKYLVNTIIQKAKEIYDEFPYEKIGVGTPGTVDFEKGICVKGANLPYNNTPIKEMIEKELKIESVIANDATCAVCGELYAGVGKQYKNFIMLTLGTGVGGGIVINGKPYFGSSGGAGEFGHIIIDYNGEKCGCGQNGCYERYASVTALINQTEIAAKENPDSLLSMMCKEKITGKTAFDAMRAGCYIAQEVVDNYISYIAIGLQSLLRVFQPDGVAIGGAISNEGDFLLKPLKEKVTLTENIIISDLKNDAGIIGAVAIAKEDMG